MDEIRLREASRPPAEVEAKRHAVKLCGMSALPEILAHNAAFVAGKQYEEFLTSPLPDKRLVVITCMDTHLVELLPKAMGIRNGDVNVIKTAGEIVAHPFGSVMRSILVAVYQLGARRSRSSAITGAV